jgi:hypothetical protein
MVTKHNVNEPVYNVNAPVRNVNQPDRIVNESDDNVNASDLTCLKCSKVFKFKCRLSKHTPVCRGVIDPKSCDYCKKTFKHSDSKYHHHKICKVRIEKESNALVPAVTTTEMSASTINNANTIQNINGDNIQNQTNNNNNITNINLVVYNSNPLESIQFNHNHIDPTELQKLFVAGDRVQPERLQNIVREWTQQLMSNDDNKCVKKTNIRSSHSKVYVGNNTWESRLDKDVYPHLMNNIANDFSEFFNENYRRSVYQALDKFIDYMASDGYCSNDSDKVIENSYKTLVRELKLRMFDITKRDVPQ